MASTRFSVAVLAGCATLACLLVGLADGLAAAASCLALLTVGGLAVLRYAAGAAAQDSGLRKRVRLLGGRAPALGEWRRTVEHALGAGGEVYFATGLRPQLQRVFAARLAERHGADLYRDPAGARRLVGAELWPWLDPQAPPPQPRLPEPVLRALLDRLDAL
ncbi:hypothetical protein [Actinacidiphila yeochonensis]|uniref:hypothetical protein n=1 Tax=Actinacidiphila yeochonensis TaxID=89050 RepID=UPI0012FEE879|nr:hypothetical protein [Actinacidiphila yeochonensis]